MDAALFLSNQVGIYQGSSIMFTIWTASFVGWVVTSVFVKLVAAAVDSEKSWVATQPTQEGRNSR
jgi:hypothetical protein